MSSSKMVIPANLLKSIKHLTIDSHQLRDIPIESINLESLKVKFREDRK